MISSYQTQKYWIYIKDCFPFLLNKEYNKYLTCALEAFEKASQEKEEEAWCVDSDGGKDYFTKGIVKTDIYPQGKDDYLQTFPNGITYLMEGFCSNKNQYSYMQKKCSDFGKKYYPKEGACVHENKPPVLTDIGNKEINAGELLTFSVSASDPDKDNLLFSVEGLPAGATFENKLFSWKPNYGQAGMYNVKFIVSDGESEDSETTVIMVKNVNQSPVLDIIDDKKITEGAKLAFVVTATDVDGDILTFSADGLPVGASFDPNAKIFNWIPAKGQSGEYEVMFKVSDGEKDDYIVVKIIVVANECGWPTNSNIVQQTNDGGCISVGVKFGDEGWVFKVGGEVEWSYSFGGVLCGDGNFILKLWVDSFQQTDDGGYIVTAGSISSAGPSGGPCMSTWSFKLDKNGNLLWGG